MRTDLAAPAFRYRQLVTELCTQIRSGALRPGERLPSLREMHRRLGLALNTVYHAYAELESQGLVDARPRSGFVVRARPEALAPPRYSRRPSAAAHVRLSEITAAVVADANNPALVPLGASTLAPELLPQRQLARALRALLRPAGTPRLVGYENVDGAPALRRQLAVRLLGLGPGLDEAGLVVTNGCTEAVALALMATTSRGDLVAVESPTHFAFLQLLRALDLRAVELPTDPRTGVLIEGVSELLRRERVRAVLLMPNFQNPTGALVPEAAREELVATLQRHDVPLIEDDVYAELYFGARRPGLLRRWDTRGLVLTCSSFSKVLSPGLRVGWVVASERFAGRIRALKAAVSMASPTLDQELLSRFLVEGALDRHLRLLRAAVHRQVARTALALEEHFPAGCRYAFPEGGNMLWVELPAGADGVRLYREARAAGISIVPGAAFSTTARFRGHFRLSCTSPFSPPIDGALRTLGRLVRAQLR